MIKKRLAVLILVLLLILIIAFMLLSRNLNLEIFFVLWLIGILIIIELISGVYATPRCKCYLIYVN